MAPMMIVAAALSLGLSAAQCPGSPPPGYSCDGPGSTLSVSDNCLDDEYFNDIASSPDQDWGWWVGCVVDIYACVCDTVSLDVLFPTIDTTMNTQKHLPTHVTC